MERLLDGFSFAEFLFVLRADEPIELPPYKGSTFRGGFGHAFKKVVCAVKRRDCDSCILKTRCIYFYVFETSPPKDSEALRNYQKIPHPFIIEPPLETRRLYKPGTVLTFNLILIGRASDYLPYFVYTFEELGRNGIGRGRGRYTLVEVRRGGIPSDEDPIYSAGEGRLKGSYTARAFSNIQEMEGKKEMNAVTLDLLTPLRIAMNNDLVVDLEFHHLIRSLLRRISTLSYFHCGQRIDLDFRGLIERAQRVKATDNKTRWHDWERYSARQGGKMKMGGVVGKISFQGDLEEFIPLLRLGEIIHTGKGTSFGLGKYRMYGTR